MIIQEELFQANLDVVISATLVGYSLRTKRTFKCELYLLFTLLLLVLALLFWNHCVCIVWWRQWVLVFVIENIVHTHIHTHFLVLTIKRLRKKWPKHKNVQPVAHITVSKNHFLVKEPGLLDVISVSISQAGIV